MPFFRDDLHYLLRIQLGLLPLDNFPALLREKQIWAQRLSRRLHVFLDLLLFLLEVSSDEVTVLAVPEQPLRALFKRLELCFAGRHQISLSFGYVAMALAGDLHVGVADHIWLLLRSTGSLVARSGGLLAHWLRNWTTLPASCLVEPKLLRLLDS